MKQRLLRIMLAVSMVPLTGPIAEHAQAHTVRNAQKCHVGVLGHCSRAPRVQGPIASIRKNGYLLKVGA